MPNKSNVRHIMLPILGIVIAAVIFILPNHDGSTSYDDIASIIVSAADGASSVMTDVKDKAAFITWLSDFVPEDAVSFTDENPAFISETADITAVVQSVPSENGSLYMYLYAEGGSLYYNGIEYESTQQEMDNFHAFLELKNN